jgi:hypothetical protein
VKRAIPADGSAPRPVCDYHARRRARSKPVSWQEQRWNHSQPSASVRTRRSPQAADIAGCWSSTAMVPPESQLWSAQALPVASGHTWHKALLK